MADDPYLDRLIEAIGGPAITAILDMVASGDHRSIWLRYVEETHQTPKDAAVMEAARSQPTITSEDLCSLWPDLSPSTLSNRLTKLEKLGLLVRIGDEPVRWGGRRFVYRAWDAPANGADPAKEGRAP